MSATGQAEMEREIREARKRAQEEQDHRRAAEEENRHLRKRVAEMEADGDWMRQKVQRLEGATQKQDARLCHLEKRASRAPTR